MEVTTEVFGRKVTTNALMVAQLVELEETGAITVHFADTAADENDCAEFGLYRIRLRPREIWELVSAVVEDREVPDELEALLCGLRPWRYEKLDPQQVYAHGWEDEEEPRGPLGLVD